MGDGGDVDADVANVAQVNSGVNGVAKRDADSSRAISSQIDAIYAKLPKLECKGLCQSSCGPIGMLPSEMARIEHETGKLPLVMTDMVSAVAMEFEPDFFCPKLDQGTGKCLIHAIRPLICRLWGSVKRMQCEHGCVPERWLEDKEAWALMNELLEIG